MIRRVCKALLMVLIFALLASGCKSKKTAYSFRQEQNNIDRIEICAYESISQKITKLVELSDAEEKQLLVDLSAINCFEYLPGDYPREYGETIICIHYYDGETEIIGETNIGWITPEGQWSLTNYSYDWEAMRSLIAQYTNDGSGTETDQTEQ